MKGLNFLKLFSLSVLLIVIGTGCGGQRQGTNTSLGRSTIIGDLRNLTGQAIPFANVTNLRSGQTVQADEHGMFVLSDTETEAGQVDLAIESDDFSVVASVADLEDGKTVGITFTVDTKNGEVDVAAPISLDDTSSESDINQKSAQDPVTGGDASSADEISSDKKDSKKSDQKDSKDSKDSSDDKKDFGTGGEATPVPYTATKTDGPDTDGDGEGYKAATPSPYTPPSVGDYGSTSGASGNLGQASSSQGSSANQGADDFTSLHGDEADKKNEVNDSKGDSTSGADKSAQASSSDDTSDDTTSSVVVIGPSHSSLHGGFNQAGF